MNWGSVANFLDMGGYAWYVWGAYGVTTVVIVAEIVSLRAQRRRVVQEVTVRARGSAAER
jgi:heme exporter protein D